MSQGTTLAVSSMGSPSWDFTTYKYSAYQVQSCFLWSSLVLGWGHTHALRIWQWFTTLLYLYTHIKNPAKNLFIYIFPNAAGLSVCMCAHLQPVLCHSEENTIFKVMRWYAEFYLNYLAHIFAKVDHLTLWLHLSFQLIAKGKITVFL